jgi:hypothetical protein
MVERGGLSAISPALLYTRRVAIKRTLRSTSPLMYDLFLLAHAHHLDDNKTPATVYAKPTPTRRGRLP